MKCPKCHKEVEKGSLYCPYCLAEIPWVREFSTVETLMKKEQQNRPSEKKQKTEIIKYFKHPKRRKLKFSRKQLLCLLLCAATLLGFFCYRQLNTFSALYSRAKKQYAQQNGFIDHEFLSFFHPPYTPFRLRLEVLHNQYASRIHQPLTLYRSVYNVSLYLPVGIQS